MNDYALEVDDLVAGYGSATVLSGVSLKVPRGGSVALVGESGSGKSTLARVVMGLKAPTGGRVVVEGQPLGKQRLAGVQMIFQDPLSSLNPRRTLADIVAEPLTIGRIGSPNERRERARALLNQVGLPPERYAEARPADVSGGQAQRVAIARALAARPRLLVCDEPVSALDVSVQATVLNLFAELRESERLSVLFISHDLAVVRMVCDEVCVLKRGVIVESGPTEQVIQDPQHPYTQTLIAAAPRLASPPNTNQTTESETR